MPGIGGDTYIVRVYRRSRGDPAQLVGVVEAVRTGRKTPFHNMTELWDVLALASHRPRSAAATTKRTRVERNGK
jgi:hypothetical protein